MTGRLLAVAAAAVAVLYGRAWRFDLQCDDWVIIRPWPAAELAGVWHGTWDPQHAFAVFFRPLASWFFAGTFELFGVHAPAHLLLSLVLLTAVVFLLAVFVARESGSTALGALSAVIYAAHPNTPWSTGVWVMNDFHKLAALAVLAALLIWQRVRYRPATAWWPIAGIAAAAFLVKEDNLMLLPALLTVQTARAWWLRDVRPPSATLWGAVAVLTAGLWTWRGRALGELGGFPFPDSVEQIVRNVIRGPYYALTGQGAASTGFTVTALVIGAFALGVIAVSIAKLPRARQWPAISALILMAWYAAPLSLVSNVTRYYVITLGAAIVLATAAAALWNAARTTTTRAGVALALGAVLIVSVSRQQAELDGFSDCGRLPIACRAWVLESIPTLPPEAATLETNTSASCRAGDTRHIDDSDVLTWGLRGAVVDTATGARFREADDHVVTLLRASAIAATVVVRHPEATAEAPIDVVISVDGHDATRLRLTSQEWVTATVALSPGWRTWLRGMHRADAVVTAGGAKRRGLEWQSFVTRD